MSEAVTTREEVKAKLVRLARKWKTDPLAFAQNAFPWGKRSLEGMTGPDVWQTKVLTELRDHIQSGMSLDEAFRLAVASGHGVGKSALVAWLVLWAMSTAADTRGVVTANTETQLRTKTFAELAKWYNLCIFRPWFDMSALSLTCRQPGHEKTWRIDAIPWSESNPEAFQGLHNNGKRLIVIFDEASGIPQVINDVIEGAMSDRDTQLMWFQFGNPNNSSGPFYECFHRNRHRWRHMHVDSRDAAVANREELQKLVDMYGEDSDFVRVRIRGVFPNSSSLQFISRKVADEAATRALPHIEFTRLVAILGVDVARFGDDQSVITCRIGQDARSFPQRKFRGLDGFELGAKIAEWYNELKDLGIRKILINLDVGGVGASPADWLRHNSYPVNEINFGSAPTNPRYKNLRAEMWGRGLEWMKVGGCIANDEDLITDLTQVEYGYTIGKNELILERKEDMKKRGLQSPDCADSLMLTFAVPTNEYLDDLPSPHRTQRHASARGPRDPYAA